MPKDTAATTLLEACDWCSVHAPSCVNAKAHRVWLHEVIGDMRHIDLDGVIADISIDNMTFRFRDLAEATYFKLRWC